MRRTDRLRRGKATRSKGCGESLRERKLRLGCEPRRQGQQPSARGPQQQTPLENQCSQDATDQSHAVSSCSFSIRQTGQSRLSLGVVEADCRQQIDRCQPPLLHVPRHERECDTKKISARKSSQPPGGRGGSARTVAAPGMPMRSVPSSVLARRWAGWPAVEHLLHRLRCSKAWLGRGSGYTPGPIQRPPLSAGRPP